jgi:CYTH domain-containing protein
MEIPLKDARDLMELCDRGVVDKTRYHVPVGAHMFEVDEFHGDNAGLVVAEVELASEDEAFERPSWLGREVTGDRRYYNSCLLASPFCTWEKND